MGYWRAGFDVFGVDIKEQPNYPFVAVEGDALLWPLDGVDAIHASPPCQDYSTLSSRIDEHDTGWMLPAMIHRLENSGLPFIVENVPGSGPAMGGQWTMLCGSSFGLKVRRHRLFRSNIALLSLPCNHSDQGQPLGVYGTGGGGQMTRGRKATRKEAPEAMGIDWPMTPYELSQAIPPAYTEYLGEQLLSALEVRA